MKRYIRSAVRPLGKMPYDSRMEVASRESTSYRDLVKLSKDRSVRVREMVATNQAAPPDILAKLAADPSHIVRMHVAMHKRTPAEALRMLAHDSDSFVCSQVASNPNTPVDVLVALYDECEPNDYDSIFFNLATNPNTPSDILKKLAVCGHHTTEFMAEHNPNYPGDQK